MNEIEDIKNHVMGLTHKIDSILKFIERLRVNDDKVNEVLHIIHNMNYEKSKENNEIFNSVFPDIIKRLNDLESKQRESDRKNKNKEILHSMNIERLNILDRTARGLRAEKINTIGDVLSKNESDLKKIVNFGRRSLDDLKKALAEHNLFIKE